MRKRLLFLLLVFGMMGAVVVNAADQQTVALMFHVPLTVSLDVDKYSIDFGDLDMYDEIWAPVGADNSFKVNIQDNSGYPWEFRINLLDDLRREEGVSSEKDVIKANDMRWALVYAGYFDNESGEQGAQVEVKNTNATMDGLNKSILELTDGQKGTPFQLDRMSDDALVFRNQFNGSALTSYKRQFVFKFIAKPPFNTTAGTYRGNIIMTLMTQ